MDIQYFCTYAIKWQYEYWLPEIFDWDYKTEGLSILKIRNYKWDLWFSIMNIWYCDVIRLHDKPKRNHKITVLVWVSHKYKTKMQIKSLSNLVKSKEFEEFKKTDLIEDTLTPYHEMIELYKKQCYVVPYNVWDKTTKWVIDRLVLPHYYNSYTTWWYVVLEDNIETSIAHEDIILL